MKLIKLSEYLSAYGEELYAAIDYEMPLDADVMSNLTSLKYGDLFVLPNYVEASPVLLGMLIKVEYSKKWDAHKEIETEDVLKYDEVVNRSLTRKDENTSNTTSEDGTFRNSFDSEEPSLTDKIEKTQGSSYDGEIIEDETIKKRSKTPDYLSAVKDFKSLAFTIASDVASLLTLGVYYEC